MLGLNKKAIKQNKTKQQERNNRESFLREVPM